MHKNILIVVGITILFLGLCISPSVAVDNIEQCSMPISNKTIITVDDEGDGDYSSIKEAVLNANSGDTIEVYSGIYNENDILINKEEIVLKGISSELGSGNDTGKPYLYNSSEKYIIDIIANDVVLAGFKIENIGDHPYAVIFCITNGSSITDNEITDGWFAIYAFGNQNVIANNTISNCYSGLFIKGKNSIISNNTIDTTNKGISVYNWAKNLTISNNKIKSGQHGILLKSSENCVITGNKITCTGEFGIKFEYNKFNTIFLNEIINSRWGIYLEHSIRNLIKQNNFINNSNHSAFYNRLFNRNRWINNYWDDWNRFGPYKVKGFLFLFYIPWISLIGFPMLGFLPIGIPWINIDWHPAKEPYDIGV